MSWGNILSIWTSRHDIYGQLQAICKQWALKLEHEHAVDDGDMMIMSKSFNERIENPSIHVEVFCF